MKISHADEDKWAIASSAHRDGRIEFLPLLSGEEGRPDNYCLVLARTDVDFRSPRHRHNFEQVRFSLRGETNIGPKNNIREGQLAYFPEGVYYGPQHQEEVGAPSISLVLQFGGPSGAGYMSQEQMRRAVRELSELGRFENGTYRAAPTAGAEAPRPQDGYEALWEHASGTPLRYAPGRYEQPIAINPGAFPWLEDAGAEGTPRHRHLATFSERGVALEMVQLPAGGEARVAADGAPRIGFVCAGQARAEGGEPLRVWSAFALAKGESARLASDTGCELLLMSLPRFG